MKLKEQKFDLIVSSWKMANMDGLEFFNKVRRNVAHKETPFILITSEIAKDKVMEAVDAGIVHYMAKPISTESLNVKVKSILG